MTSAQAEKNKAKQCSQPTVASFLVSHMVSYTPANSLLLFKSCQRRLKRTEVHNDEENKQQARTQGDNRDEGRRESPERCNLKLL